MPTGASAAGRLVVWERLLTVLAADADNEYAMIDATIMRAHQHSAGAKKKPAKTRLGRSKGGLSTKVHVLVDALGTAEDRSDRRAGS